MPPSIRLGSKAARRKPVLGRRKALLIGMNYASKNSSEDFGFGELKGPVSDVREMKKTLIHIYEYQEQDIVIMTDTADLAGTAFWPTRGNIIDAIKALVRDARSEDTFMFHYAGHSDQIPAKFDRNEADGKDEVVITCEHEQLVDDDLRKYLIDPLPPGSRLTAILDSCHSGTLLDLKHYDCNTRFRMRRFSEPTIPFNVPLPKIRRRATIGNRDQPISYLAPPRSKLTGWKCLKAKVLPVAHIQIRLRMARSIKRQEKRSAQFLKCGRYCEHDLTNGPTVISVSACSDHQQAWESEDSRSNRTSMTMALIRILNETPFVTVDNLYNCLRTSLYHTAFTKHRSIHRWYKTEGPKLTEEDREEYQIDSLLKFDVQIPQVGSLRRLDKSEKFIDQPRLMQHAGISRNHSGSPS